VITLGKPLIIYSPTGRRYFNEVKEKQVIILNLNPSLYRDFFDGVENPQGVAVKTYKTFPHFLRTLQKNGWDRVLMFLPGKSFNPSKIRRVCLLLIEKPIYIVTDKCDEKAYLTYISSGITGIITPPFHPLDFNSVIEDGRGQKIKFNKSKELIREGHVRLDFLIPSKLSRIIGVNRLVSFLMAEFGFPPEDYRVNLPMVMDEALSNAIVHGNSNKEELKVHVRIYISSSRIAVKVEDEGEGFDAESVKDPTGDENIYNGSGRGIYIIREIMDRVELKKNGSLIEMEKANNLNYRPA